jgi:ethanolamine transporter EutH
MSIGLKFARDNYLARGNVSGIVVTVACFVVFCCVGASYIAEHSGLIDHTFALVFNITVVIIIPAVSGVAYSLLRRQT